MIKGRWYIISNPPVSFLIRFDEINKYGFILASKAYSIDDSAYFHEGRIFTENYHIQFAPNSIVERYFSGTPKEETFYDRLLKEAQELSEKIEKLKSFLLKGRPESIEEYDWGLLEKQLSEMKAYWLTLCHRIERLKQKQ